MFSQLFLLVQSSVVSELTVLDSSKFSCEHERLQDSLTYVCEVYDLRVVCSTTVPMISRELIW